jgi:Putative zinc-finger
VMHPGQHLADESLSALVDEQLNAEEARSARAHLETCSACQQHLDELRSVVALLRAMPDVEPPRQFLLGPRAVADPPNVVRLRRWYGGTRAAAASLAAVFVFLSVGALYIDLQPAASPTSLAAKPQLPTAPADANQSAPTPAVKAAAPAPAAAVRQAPAGAQGAESDQVAAATSVRPLPTPVPTPSPTPLPLPLPRPVTSTELDAAAPLRTAAAIVGVLAALTLLVTVLVRHRLQAVSVHPL